MDPEQTFLRVHARLSGMLVQLLTPRIRMALEHMSFVLSLALLGILVVMHVNFVAQSGCANELSGSNIIESQLVQIKITSGGLWSQRMTELSQINAAGQTHSLESFQFQEVDGDGLTFLSAKFWLNWIGSGARRSKGMSKLLKSSEGILDSQPKGVSEGTICNAIGKQMDVRVGPEMAQREFLSSGRDSFRAAISQILDKWNRNNSAFFKGIKQFVFSGSEIWKIAGWELLMDLPKSLRMLRWRRLDSLLGGTLSFFSHFFGAHVEIFVLDCFDDLQTILPNSDILDSNKFLMLYQAKELMHMF